MSLNLSAICELIIEGKKIIELRKWNTKFRGEFLVHAAKNILEEDCRRMKISSKTLTTGAIIGKVNLVDVKKYESNKELKADKTKHYSSSDFPNNKYGFILEKPKRLRYQLNILVKFL